MPAERRASSLSGSTARKFDLDLILNDSTSDDSESDSEGHADASQLLLKHDTGIPTAGGALPRPLDDAVVPLPTTQLEVVPVSKRDAVSVHLSTAQVLCDDADDGTMTVGGVDASPSDVQGEQHTYLREEMATIAAPQQRWPSTESHTDKHRCDGPKNRFSRPLLNQQQGHGMRPFDTLREEDQDGVVASYASWPGMVERLSAEKRDLQATVERLESELKQSRSDMRFLQDAQAMLHANDVSADAVTHLEAAHRDRERALEEQVEALLDTVAMWKARALAERDVTIPIGVPNQQDGPEPRSWTRAAYQTGSSAVGSRPFPTVVQRSDAATGPRGCRNAASQATPHHTSCGTSCSPAGDTTSVTTQTSVTGAAMLAELSRQRSKDNHALRFMRYDVAAQTVECGGTSMHGDAVPKAPNAADTRRPTVEPPPTPHVAVPRRHVGLQCALAPNTQPVEALKYKRRDWGVQAVAPPPRRRNASTSTVAATAVPDTVRTAGGQQRQQPLGSCGGERHTSAGERGGGPRGSRALVNSLALLKQRIDTLRHPPEPLHGDAVHLGVPEVQLIRRDTTATASATGEALHLHHHEPSTSNQSFVFECEDAAILCPSPPAPEAASVELPCPLDAAAPSAVDGGEALLLQLVPKLLTVVDQHMRRQHENCAAMAASTSRMADADDEADDGTQQTPRTLVPQPIKCYRETGTSPIGDVPQHQGPDQLEELRDRGSSPSDRRVRRISICEDVRVSDEREANALLKRLLRRTEAAFKEALRALHHENAALRRQLELVMTDDC